jgi:hypothetical protein
LDGGIRLLLRIQDLWAFKLAPPERRYSRYEVTNVIAWDFRGRALRPSGLGLLLSDKSSAKEV